MNPYNNSTNFIIEPLTEVGSRRSPKNILEEQSSLNMTTETGELLGGNCTPSVIAETSSCKPTLSNSQRRKLRKKKMNAVKGAVSSSQGPLVPSSSDQGAAEPSSATGTCAKITKVGEVCPVVTHGPTVLAEIAGPSSAISMCAEISKVGEVCPVVTHGPTVSAGIAGPSSAIGICAEISKVGEVCPVVTHGPTVSAGIAGPSSAIDICAEITKVGEVCPVMTQGSPALSGSPWSCSEPAPVAVKRTRSSSENFASMAKRPKVGEAFAISHSGPRHHTGGCRVAVIPLGYPSVQLTREQGEEIEDLLVNALDQLAIGGGESPKFSGFSYRLGGLIINCDNQATKTWMSSVLVGRIISGGIKLRIGNVDELRNDVKVGGFFPGKKVTVDLLLRRIMVQNDDVPDVTGWGFLGVKEEDNGLYVVLRVPQSSVKHLEHREFMINYGLKKVILRVFDKKKPPRPEVTSSKGTIPKEEKKDTDMREGREAP